MKGPGGIIWDVGGTMAVRTLLEYDYIKVACREAGVTPAPLSKDDLKRLSVEFKLAQDSWRTLAEERAGMREMARKLLGGEC